jgi:VacB/RNase II family 3'-5' exoribonuclease
VAGQRIRAPRIDFAALRRELELPEEFPPTAQRDAERAAASGASGASRTDRTDRTDLPFVTIDPPTSRDLDQALRLERRDSGYRVYYAIADVASFVEPGSALDQETQQRGQTIYFPDEKVPLHPPVLSEGATSLLPDESRPAVLWTIDLDADGATTEVWLERALVRSRAKLNYAQVQADVETGTLAEPVRLLPEIGRLLIDQGLARGAIDLPMPEQEVEPHDGGWQLELRARLPVEEYNAEISLLAGRAAAGIMLAGGIGLLRTMPPAPPEALTKLRAAAHALGIDWPEDNTVGTLLTRLKPSSPRDAAFIQQAAELMRGAAYTSFDGVPPEDPAHAAVAAPYAHVTAPLRRLADRYATEVCLALHDGREVPAYVRETLPDLPAAMGRTDRIAHAAEKAAVDLVEAILLRDRVGETFEAAVLDVDERGGGTIALDDPPVRARSSGPLTLGERARVRLVAAEPETRSVKFVRVTD